MYTSFVVVFSDHEPMDETSFEKHLWARLQGIHNHDSAPWDPRVSSDPAALDFSYSVGGQGFYVIGLHPGASRPARRFNRAAIVFNLHQQFETLRQDGQYERMRDVIRERDAAYSGSTNPMLADFGAVPEARQYSGRVTPDAWRCPFQSRH